MKTMSNLNADKRKLSILKKYLSIACALGLTANVSSVNVSEEGLSSEDFFVANVDDVITGDSKLNLDKDEQFYSVDSKMDYMNVLIKTYLTKEKLNRLNYKDVSVSSFDNISSLNRKDYSSLPNDLINFSNLKTSLEKFEVMYDEIHNDMIAEFANIYFLDYNTVEQLYNSNKSVIDSSENPKKTFIVMVKDYFYQTDIDKTPIVSNKTREEKEDYIIHMAKDIYGVEDKELLALILAIHRLETGNSTSRRCVYDNNLGGVTDGSGFLTFKTFEIGAECFVRTVTNRVNEAYASPYYDYSLPIEYNIQEVYCDSSWGPQINPIKVSILNSGELDKYFNDKQKKLS